LYLFSRWIMIAFSFAEIFLNLLETTSWIMIAIVLRLFAVIVYGGKVKDNKIMLLAMTKDRWAAFQSGNSCAPKIEMGEDLDPSCTYTIHGWALWEYRFLCNGHLLFVLYIMCRTSCTQVPYMVFRTLPNCHSVQLVQLVQYLLVRNKPL
jgi:hypothetical protein